MIDEARARHCLNCNSTTTYLQNGKYEDWYHYKDGYICNKCYHKLITNPNRNNSKWNTINNPRRMTWSPLRKKIFLKKNPRKGQCQRCLKSIGDEFVNCFGQTAIVKETQIHHLEYHEDDPLKDTIELCASCHRKETHRLGREVASS